MDPGLLLPRAAGVADRIVARASRSARVSRWIDTEAIYLRLAMIRGAAEVTDSTRFALNELARRSVVRGYRLRGSDLRIFVRHPFSDAWVVDEVLRREVYRPPAVLMDQLHGLDELRIVDLGAHIGTTTLYLLSLFPRANVTAVEPNGHNASLLRAAITANGLEGSCTIVQAAAGTTDGSAQMEGYSLLSHVVRSDEVDDRWRQMSRAMHAEEAAGEEIPVTDALPLLMKADLVKIDIEGGEWEILADPRLRETPIRGLVMEYHPNGCPGADTTSTVRAMLAEAGFVSGEPYDEHDGVGMIWAWRADSIADVRLIESRTS